MTRCDGCNDVLPVRVLHLETRLPELRADDPPRVFVLCTECYVHIRTGYQRDRDRRAANLYQGPTIYG